MKQTRIITCLVRLDYLYLQVKDLELVADYSEIGTMRFLCSCEGEFLNIAPFRLLGASRQIEKQATAS